jgi:hypothetical protein
VSEQFAEMEIDARSEAEAKLEAAERAEEDPHLVPWTEHHTDDAILYRVAVHPPE